MGEVTIIGVDLAKNVFQLHGAAADGRPACDWSARLVRADGSVSGERNDVSLAGLNHKCGYRGTVNTLLNFGEGRFPVKAGNDTGVPRGPGLDGQGAGAIGYLIGQPGKGLAAMFTMMNGARIGVGLGACGMLIATHWMELNNMTPVLAIMIGLAVGIDYALFIVNRFRNELITSSGLNNLTPKELAKELKKKRKVIIER